MNRTCLAILTFLCLAELPATAAEDATDRTLSPYFFVEQGDRETDRLPLEETRADVRITGVIADVVVTQVYRNEGTRPINARYVFPASTRAAVHGMTLTVGEHRVRAQIKERQIAQQQYERAQAEGKSAALLEQQRPNVFSMRVANVMPGDEIRVELHYSELLVPTDGTYEFVYPTVVGPRYSSEPEAAAPETDRWVKSPYLHGGQPPTYLFDLQVRIAAGMPLEQLLCTSHQTSVEWEDRSTARVSLDPDEARGGNRDFVLRYRLQGDEVETGLLLYRGEQENFFLLLVEPPAKVRPEQVPPREYVFVLDVSGSMHGFPLDTAKTLMRALVAGLRPADRFNVLLFSGGSRLLSPQSLPATQASLEEALRIVDAEDGGGGTELAAALRRALALPATAGMSRSVVVVTDGFISAETEALDLIRENLGQSNLFAFGIGGSVNRFLIEGLAKAGQGEPFVVTVPAEAEEAARRFHDYVSSPVLTRVAVASEGFEIYDVEPPSIPDVFAARPVVVFGKWRGEAAGTLRVSGMGGAGAYERRLDVADYEAAEEHHAIRYLWARSRVARLSDYGWRRDDEKKLEVTTLGLTYELLTAYTSFIAVHEVVRNHAGDAEDVDQPLPLPEGVSDLAVGCAVPEPGLGALLILCSFAWLLARHRRWTPARSRR